MLDSVNFNIFNIFTMLTCIYLLCWTVNINTFPFCYCYLVVLHSHTPKHTQFMKLLADVSLDAMVTPG